jgi:SAM-dependent methyltransferase
LTTDVLCEPVKGGLTVQPFTLGHNTHSDNNAWCRQIAAHWVRRMLQGDSPGTWVHNTETQVRFAISHLNLHPGDRVLDLGCGWGRHSLMLAAYGLHVIGLELSRDLLALAQYNTRRHNLDIQWIEADLAFLPLQGSFDAIAQFCGNLMTWFNSRDQTLEALRNVAHLLRPGGRILFGTDDWQPELPSRSHDWDEWSGGAAIYRQKYDRRRRISETQTVIFGPQHERREYRRQTWWPSIQEMEDLLMQARLVVCGRYNTFADRPFDPQVDGLVYVLTRE